MIESAIMLLFNSFLFMLRLSSGDSFPKPLSSDEEQRCLELWAQGDVDARNKLVEHNLRLVAHIMKKYYAQADDVDDLISIGTVGLIKGINSYKPDKGVRLATYASRCIENEVLMHFRSAKKSAGDMSLSEALDLDSEGGGLSIMDLIAQEDDMTEVISSRELCKELREQVKSCLTAREQKIISLRYGLEGRAPLTQRETAALCGISRSYVSRIEKKALEKLRLVIGDESRPC